MEQSEAGSTWWQSFYRPHPVVFLIIILAGLDLEYVIHYSCGITIVYTQLYYLIIVIAGLWYGRKAVWIALFFGGLHVIVSYILTGLLSPDALMRALILLMVAFVTGSLVEQMREYQAAILKKNRELSDMNAQMQVLNTQLAKSLESCRDAEKR
jgi:hypothetical protein